MADLYSVKGYDHLYPNAIPCAFRFADSDVRIEWRGGREEDQDKWAIITYGLCYTRDGEWEHEPQPSSRTAEFLSRCRYSLAEALEVVTEAIASEKW